MIPSGFGFLSDIAWRLATHRGARRRRRRARLQRGDLPTITPAQLVMEFESLGDNCEFGLVQRFCGVEPLGLFRFSGSRTDSLISAVSARLEPIGTDEDLCLDAFYEDDEIQGCSRFYDDFIYHTEVAASTGDLVALRARELQKLAYLKRKFLEDAASGEKIFVRKEGGFDKAAELFAALRRLGPNNLLWIEGEERHWNAGEVETAKRGLYRGHVRRLAAPNDAPALDLRGWLALCLEALRIIRGRHYRLAPNDVLQQDETWSFEKLCDGREIGDGPRFLDRRVFEIVLRDDTVRADATVASRYIETPVPEKSLVSFSVWVFVPSSFQGSFIDVYFPFAEEGHLCRADLAIRDQWQRVWTSSRLRKGQTTTEIALRVTGRRNDTIFLSTWRYENGCLPNAWVVPPPTVTATA